MSARERESARSFFKRRFIPVYGVVSPYWEYRSDGVVPVASGQTELVLAFSIYLFYSLFPNDRGNEIIWFRPPLTQHTHVIVSNAFCWRKMRISNANLSSCVIDIRFVSILRTVSRRGFRTISAERCARRGRERTRAHRVLTFDAESEDF